MKPIDYDALLKHKEDSAALRASIAFNAVVKKKNKASTASSTNDKIHIIESQIKSQRSMNHKKMNLILI